MESPTLAQKLFGFSLHRHVQRQLRDHFIPHEGNAYRPHTLRHRTLFLYSALLIVVKFAVVTSPLLMPYGAAESAAVTPQNVISLTNQSRSENNLPALILSPKLSVAAQNKAKDMMAKGYFAHFSPEGVSPWYWISSAGYAYQFAGENLAIRFSTAEGVNAAWLSSPAHRANLLSKDFKEVGVAVVTDNFGTEGPATLVVQMFGSQAEVSGNSATAVPVNNPPPLQIIKKVADKVSSENSFISPPHIAFPLDNSYVNKSRFKVMGSAESGASVDVYVEGKLFGEALISADRNFDFYPDEEKSLSDGVYSLYARAKDNSGRSGPKSAAVTFTIDTQAPEVFKDKFSFLPDPVLPAVYKVAATVSADSVRTIVTVGADSAVLDKSDNGNWEGTIRLFNLDKSQNAPIELFTQDIAGNEAKQRVGWLNRGDVRGVFSGAQTSPSASGGRFSIMGLVEVPNFDSLANNFYLYFVAFLTFSLMLMIGLKRHIQHPKTIAAASSVIMLAALLFMI